MSFFGGFSKGDVDFGAAMAEAGRDALGFGIGDAGIFGPSMFDFDGRERSARAQAFQADTLGPRTGTFLDSLADRVIPSGQSPGMFSLAPGVGRAISLSELARTGELSVRPGVNVSLFDPADPFGTAPSSPSSNSVADSGFGRGTGVNTGQTPGPGGGPPGGDGAGQTGGGLLGSPAPAPGPPSPTVAEPEPKVEKPAVAPAPPPQTFEGAPALTPSAHATIEQAVGEQDAEARRRAFVRSILNPTGASGLLGRPTVSRPRLLGL